MGLGVRMGLVMGVMHMGLLVLEPVLVLELEPGLQDSEPSGLNLVQRLKGQEMILRIHLGL